MMKKRPKDILAWDPWEYDLILNSMDIYRAYEDLQTASLEAALLDFLRPRYLAGHAPKKQPDTPPPPMIKPWEAKERLTNIASFRGILSTTLKERTKSDILKHINDVPEWAKTLLEERLKDS